MDLERRWCVPAPGARPGSNLTCVTLREFDAQRDVMRAGEARGLGAVSDGDFIIAITVISIKLAPDRKVQRNRSSNLRRAYSYYGLTATYLALDRKVLSNSHYCLDSNIVIESAV